MKIELREPEIDDVVIDVLRRELKRFPYMSDENRTDTKIDMLIAELFLAPNSLALAYDGGYLVFRKIGIIDGKKTADVFWIHFAEKKFSRGHVRAAIGIMKAVIASLGLERLTMKTASCGLTRLAERCGFKNIGGEDKFTWNGTSMPVYHMIMEA